tara:strand:+ start:249 stop:779 length:531 start_codon:yes stop_codon:yes gene_type:complete
MKEKKGVSLMVSYVLLVVIAIGLAILVYYWLLPQINPEEISKCPDDTTLIVLDYSCDIDSSKDTITLIVKNQGRFNIDGFFIRGTNLTDESIPAAGLSDPNDKDSINGTHYFIYSGNNLSALKPDLQYEKTFSYSEIKELKKMQIEPFRIQEYAKGKNRVVLCDRSTITQNIVGCD